MAYFLPIPAYEYDCPGCGGRYLVPEGGPAVQCAMMHPPGSCCHLGEEEISGPRT